MFGDYNTQLGTVFNRTYIAPLGVFIKAKSKKINEPCVVFDEKEYTSIKESTDLVQMCAGHKGEPVIRQLDTPTIVEKGDWIYTPKGLRWGVPLSLWKFSAISVRAETPAIRSINPVDVLKEQSAKSLEMHSELGVPLINVPLPQKAN